MIATLRQSPTSKEAQHGNPGSPPRATIELPELAATAPLEQLWTRLSPVKRQELLGQLTRILTQRLAPPDSQEAADE